LPKPEQDFPNTEEETGKAAKEMANGVGEFPNAEGVLPGADGGLRTATTESGHSPTFPRCPTDIPSDTSIVSRQVAGETPRIVHRWRIAERERRGSQGLAIGFAKGLGPPTTTF